MQDIIWRVWFLFSKNSKTQAKGKAKDIVELKRTCIKCGNSFKVKVNKRTGRIYGLALYFGKYEEGIGDWIYGELRNGQIVKTVPFYKEIYYKARDIFRKIFKRYRVIELWECPDCVKSSLKITEKKVKPKNPSKRYDVRRAYEWDFYV